VLYYGCICVITPPVALASFTAPASPAPAPLRPAGRRFGSDLWPSSCRSSLPISGDALYGSIRISCCAPPPLLWAAGALPHDRGLVQRPAERGGAGRLRTRRSAADDPGPRDGRRRSGGRRGELSSAEAPPGQRRRIK
jgi:hypothetical protein